VQLTKTQFYESKSYPTFTPVGPALGATGRRRAQALRVICGCGCEVNGEIRQDMLVDATSSTHPWQALQALSRFQRLDAATWS